MLLGDFVIVLTDSCVCMRERQRECKSERCKDEGCKSHCSLCGILFPLWHFEVLKTLLYGVLPCKAYV